MLIRSLPTKNRTVLTRDILDIFPQIPALSVIDTDCWAQNGITHGRVFASFKCRYLINRTTNRVKNCCVYFVLTFMPFLSIGPVLFLRFGPPLKSELIICLFPSLSLRSPFEITEEDHHHDCFRIPSNDHRGHGHEHVRPVRQLEL